MSEWRPIETAPKDGTEIDVWDYCHNPKWRPEAHGIGSGRRITDVHWENGHWVQWDWEYGSYLEVDDNPEYTISHWMPVPGVPK